MAHTPHKIEESSQNSNRDVVRFGENRKTPFFSEPDQMVTFIVGSGLEKKTFIVHKEFACKHSPVLDSAFNGGFQEACTRRYILDDVKPETFRLFSEFLYTQNFILEVHNENESDDIMPKVGEIHSSKCNDQDMRLVELWVLAERFLVPRLQNRLMEHMKRICKDCARMNSDCFRYVYENTSVGSPLRRLIVDQCAWRGSAPTYEDMKIQLPHEMLLDLAVAFINVSSEAVREKMRAQIYDCDYSVEENT